MPQSRPTTLLFLTSLALAIALAVAPSDARAQFRRTVEPTLRAKPHTTEYVGVLEVVGEVGGREQYRVGPDTIGLAVTLRLSGDGTMEAEYSLDLGGDDPATGVVAYSELGLPDHLWRPALEALTVLSFLPLPEKSIAEGVEWAKLVSYVIPEIDLEFAEATQFRVRAIDGDVAQITFSAEGGGSTSIDRPQLGAGAKMEVSREGAREGSFHFHMPEGRVLSADRIERITTSSVVFMGGEAQVGPTETQTVTLSLWEKGAR